MLIQRLCLPLILQLRAVLAVMLLQAPRDWGGGYGDDPEVEWVYECEACGYWIALPEQVFGRAVPFCEYREHGRLEFVDLVEWD